MFTTVDNDNDVWSGSKCAVEPNTATSLIDTVCNSTIMVHTIRRLPSTFFTGQKLVRKRITIQIYSQSKLIKAVQKICSFAFPGLKSVCVCMYVCMYVCMFVCMNVCLSFRTLYVLT